MSRESILFVEESHLKIGELQNTIENLLEYCEIWTLICQEHKMELKNTNRLRV